MKERLGNIWTDTDSRGVLKIGFNREYIESKLGECFHVMQADTLKARKGQPLMVLETNDGTERIKSPITGTILVFNDKARNFPDRLSEEDTVMEVLPEGVKLPGMAKVKSKESYPVDWANQGFLNIGIDDVHPAELNQAPRPHWNNDEVVRRALNNIRRNPVRR